ncbi:MAG: hypothetical protein GY754_37520 [bacterium]|nr:hypothetical protein [bacterium]
MKKFIIPAFLFMIVFMTGSSAFAYNLNFKGMWVLPGINIGGSTGTGFHAGGEISVVNMYDNDLSWAGGYTDFVVSKDQFRWSIGPEFGFTFVGLDLGFLGVVPRDGDSNPRAGFTTRLNVTCGLAGVYARYNHVFNDESYFEGGVLLKFPVRSRGYY